MSKLNWSLTDLFDLKEVLVAYQQIRQKHMNDLVREGSSLDLYQTAHIKRYEQNMNLRRLGQESLRRVERLLIKITEEIEHDLPEVPRG